MSETVTLSQALQDGITLEQLLANLTARVKTSTQVESPMEKGGYIAERFPEMAANTIRLADQSLEGMMVLPGTQAKLHFVGNPPLWADNPPKDNEYTFHLNRMHHWKTMCEAYTLTGDERYADKVVQELLDWIENCPCPSIQNPDGSYACQAFEGLGLWRALEVGIRGYRTWPMVLELLIDSGRITTGLLAKLLPCVYLHCRVLYEVSPRLWPKADHNHYLMENLGLLSFACLFPELRGSDQWKEHAQQELDRCIQAQCLPCGGQIEGCPSYHNGCVFWFALRLVLAEKYNLTVSKAYSDRVRSMFRHSVHATRASGGNFPWGDSHSEKESLTLAAVSCYMAFGERDYLAVARHFYPLEHILEDLRDNLWRLGNLQRLGDDLAWADSHPHPPAYETFAWQRELNQVYMRSGWDRESISLMTGCRTPVQNLHAHMDAGGFDMTAYGTPIISDPGIFTYRDCEDRHRFKGTLWHSCLTINRRDMWEYISSWAYGPQRDGRILHAQQLDRVSYALSRHHNYHPVVATRLLALIDNRYLLVLDSADGIEPDSSVEIGFHIDRTQVELTATGAVTNHPDLPNLVIVSSGSHQQLELEEARISSINDVAHPSRILRYSRTLPHGGSYRQATLLLPLRPGQAAPPLAEPVLTQQQGRLLVKLHLEGEPLVLCLADDRLSILA